MNQEKAIEILRLFQQELKNAIEQKSLYFKVNIEEIKLSLEFFKQLNMCDELCDDIITKVNDANKSDRSISINNKIIFSSPYFKELNENLIVLFKYINLNLENN